MRSSAAPDRTATPTAKPRVAPEPGGNRPSQVRSVGVPLSNPNHVESGRSDSFIASLLFGVEPTDPLTFIAIAGLLAATAAIASLLPAIRAARVSSSDALRPQ